MIPRSGRHYEAGRSHPISYEIDSIFGKPLELPEETLVYAAHDYRGWTVSTILDGGG